MPCWIVLMRALVLFIAIVTNLQQVYGKLYLTYHGTTCTGACKLTSTEYYCDSIDRGETEMKSMLCSPESQKDVTGAKCKNECSKPGGKDYYWCKTNTITTKWSDWGYCGLVRDNTNYVTSYYDALCYDQCAKRKKDYYWCNTRKGWDYCSPKTNVDYRNKPCQEDEENKCAKHGEKYNWCNLKDGGWGYCGFLKTKLLSYRSSTYRKICKDDCEYDKEKEVYYCYTSDGWDYCSPVPDITYQGVLCRADHRCDLHSYEYYWCYIDSKNWAYCGLIEGSECEYNTPFNCIDEGNKRQTLFQYNENANIADGNQFRGNVTDLISCWNNGLLRNTTRSALVRTENFRIDMQGMVNRNNQRYHNLQIQQNRERQRGRSTTYSQVLVPENLPVVPDRYVRHAFLESFERQVGVTILVRQLTRRAG